MAGSVSGESSRLVMGREMRGIPSMRSCIVGKASELGSFLVLWVNSISLRGCMCLTVHNRASCFFLFALFKRRSCTVVLKAQFEP